MLFTEPAWVTEQAAAIEAIIARYPVPRSALMPLLHLAQDARGYIHDEDIEAVAELLGETPAFVESVCSFYSMYHRKPKGKYHLVVCGNLSCGMGGASGLVRALEETLGIKVGQTTADGLVSLEVTAECLAACDQAPCLQCNAEYVVRCDAARGTGLAKALLQGDGPDRFIEFALPGAAAAPAVAPVAEALAAEAPAAEAPVAAAPVTEAPAEEAPAAEAPAAEGGQAHGG